MVRGLLRAAPVQITIDQRCFGQNSKNNLAVQETKSQQKGQDKSLSLFDIMGDFRDDTQFYFSLAGNIIVVQI